MRNSAATRNCSRLISETRGMIMIQVIVVLLLITIMTVAIFMQTAASSSDANKRAEWVRISATATASAALVQRGLVSKLIKPSANFTLTQLQASKLLSTTDSTQVVANNSATYFAGAPEIYTNMNLPPTKGGFYEQVSPTPTLLRRSWVLDYVDASRNEYYTMVTPVEGNANQRVFWQIARIIGPSMYTSPSGRPYNNGLTVYFRTWQGTFDVSSSQYVHGEISYYKAQFSTGRFSDYQLVTDSNIVFGNGASIGGPVHSNGLATTEGLPDPWADGITIRKQAGSTVTCGGATGPSISAGDGNVSLPGCNTTSNTGEYVDILLAKQAGIDIKADAALGLSTAKNFTGLSDYIVEIDDAEVRVKQYAPAVTLGTYSTYDVTYGRKALGLNFETGNVTIDQQSPFRGKLTIAAAGEIRLTTNITPSSPSSGDVIGLISNTNIIVELGDVDVLDDTQNNGSTSQLNINSIRAAMISISGGLRIPQQWTGSIPMDSTLYFTSINYPTINVVGSIAGHNAPTLRWDWNNASTCAYNVGGASTPCADGSTPATFAGYNARNYSFDTNLAKNPPPYFPLTGAFDLESIALANQDCLKLPRAGVEMSAACK